jgi:diguanylate cyclase (GGDEF)-like protein/PAS domain S-box-containing protein
MDDHHISYKRIMEQLSDGVYFVDRKRRITFWNRGAEELTGYSRGDAVGRRCADNMLVHVDAAGEKLCNGRCPVSATLLDGADRETEAFLHHREGHRIPVRIKVSPINDDRGAVIGAVEIFSDASRQPELLERIRELERVAMIDQLTEVPNRRYLERCLDSRARELSRYGWPYGVVLLDVDEFKAVNDTHGHDVGDRVLRVVARTLAHSTRAFDVVGRWGGEEFLAVIPQVDLEVISEISDRFRRLVESAHLDLASGPLSVTVSVGAALAEEGEANQALVKRADDCLYEAKRSGRNRVKTSEYPKVP